MRSQSCASMPVNKEFQFDPEDDELSLLRQKFANVMGEKEALQKQVTALLERAKTSPAPKPAPTPNKSTIFLIIAALEVLARLALFIVVEDWGNRANDLGVLVTTFGSIALLATVAGWANYEAQTVGWLVVPNCIFLLVATLICTSVFDPIVFENGKELGTVHDPVIAATAFILCLLFAATRLLFFAVWWLLSFITDPRKVFKTWLQVTKKL